jgi:hypothetical protein
MNERARAFLQTTWTLFLTRPVVGSMKSRGNLRAGAARISDTTLRSTAPFAVNAREIVVVGSEVRPLVGPAAFLLSVDSVELAGSVTTRTATCVASSP